MLAEQRLTLALCRSFGSKSGSNTVALVRQLRSETGAPMMECQKALSASQHDLEEARQWLRQHSQTKLSQKLSGRETSEGLVGCCSLENHQAASLVQVASETDFCSRSETFSQLVETVAREALNNTTTSTTTTNKDENIPSSIQEAIKEATLSFRENLQLLQVHRLVADDDEATASVVAGYVHGKTLYSPHTGTSAAVVRLTTTTTDSPQTPEIGHRLAMHIVAAKPTYLSPEHVPEQVLNQEKTVIYEQMADSDKPKDILEKIVQGRLRKFFGEVCLTEQAHMVEEGNPKVSSFLKKHGLQVTAFERLSV